MANNYFITLCPKCRLIHVITHQCSLHGSVSLEEFSSRFTRRFLASKMTKEDAEKAFEETAAEFCDGCGYPLEDHDERKDYCGPQSGLAPG